MGRNDTLTPERQENIIALLRDGVLIKDACEIAGVPLSTFYDWLKKGDEPAAEPKFSEFSESITRARAQAKAVAVQNITGQGATDWRASAWFLERSFPKDYGKQQKIEHTGADGGPITLAGLEALMGISDDDAHTVTDH
jgi:transposase